MERFPTSEDYRCRPWARALFNASYSPSYVIFYSANVYVPFQWRKQISGG